MPVPARLQQLVDLFSSAPRQVKLQALLDYSERLPPLPDHIDADAMEQVHECQTPFFVATEIDDDGAAHLYFEAPREAPTTRGFAGIIHAGLDGEPATAVLEVPDGFYSELGLDDVITPLRLRGMGAIMARTKRQLREQLAATDP